MLDDARLEATTDKASRRSVAKMLLADDNNEGLTTRRSCQMSTIQLSSIVLTSAVDIKTILGGLMSGGFETLFSTAIITIGLLSSSEGQLIQQRAYEDILAVYETPEQAFKLSVSEEKSPYISGLVKGALRFYPPLKLLPARQTYKDFSYHGSLIPKGVLIYINAQAANRGRYNCQPFLNPINQLTRQ